MTLAHRLRAFYLKRQAEALLRRARRPYKQSGHMIGLDVPYDPLPVYVRTIDFWIVIAGLLTCLLFVNFYSQEPEQIRACEKAIAK